MNSLKCRVCVNTSLVTAHKGLYAGFSYCKVIKIDSGRKILCRTSNQGLSWLVNRANRSIRDHYTE